MVESCLNQFHYQLAFPEPVVETEHEFIDALLQNFMRHTMTCAIDELFCG